MIKLSNNPKIIIIAACAVLITLSIFVIANTLENKGDGTRSTESDKSIEKYTIPNDKLEAEATQLESDAAKINHVISAEYRLRSNITNGQQVLIDAKADTDDSGTLEQILRDLIEIGWNNDLYRPTDVNATLVSHSGSVIDASDIGLSPHSGVGPAGMYEAFGPAKADPDWRP